MKIQALLAAAWLFAFAAHGAPVAPTDGGVALGGGAENQNATGDLYILDSATKPASTSNSKTVDFLIDLQSKNAGLDFGERTRAQEHDARAGPSAPPARLRPAPQPAGHPSGLFGTTVNPGETAKEQHREDSESQQAFSRRHSAAHLRTSGAGDGTGQDDAATAASPLRRWPAIQVVIRFVRENRGLVAAAAVALLALVWGASITMSQRRR